MKNFITLIYFTGLSLATLAQSVVQVEYFVDTDAGYGQNTLVSVGPSPDVTYLVTVDFSGFTPGYHKLYFRTKDDNGIWSLTARRNIEVLISEAKTTFVKGEYFFDTDPGFGSASPIAVSDLTDSIILQNFTASISGLSEGYHKLYGRLLDKEGHWSLTFRRNINVYLSSNTSVVTAEYFFDTDQGVGDCTSVSLISPSPDGSFTINIPKSQIPIGADSLFVRVQDDTENKWSLTQILNNIIAALPLTLLDFQAIKDNNQALLKWQTANEVNVAHFDIQRSADGTNFTTVGKVAANNSGVQNSYRFNDDLSTLKAGKVFYRLQMVDNDGKFIYSKVVYVTVDQGKLFVTIHPNPAHNYFITRNSGTTGYSDARVLVRDVSGRTVISAKLSNDAVQRINIASLSKGIYTVSIVTSREIETQKLVVE